MALLIRLSGPKSSVLRMYRSIFASSKSSESRGLSITKSENTPRKKLVISPKRLIPSMNAHWTLQQ